MQPVADGICRIRLKLPMGMQTREPNTANRMGRQMITAKQPISQTAKDPLIVAANRLAKDVTPTRMTEMLNEMGVADAAAVVAQATEIVEAARLEFNAEWKTEIRKANLMGVAGGLVAASGAALAGAESAGPSALLLAGSFLLFRGLKRRDQLKRQSFRTTVRF